MPTFFLVHDDIVGEVQMSMVKVQLTGCDRYNFKNELYEKGKVYMVGEAKATIMLRKKDEYDRPYFTVYVKPTKSKAQLVAEAAAKAAAEAAAEFDEDEIVERPDGSEPEAAEPEVEVDPEAAVEVEVDTDDDPSLDEEDEPNSEEVEVDEDRDDGTAVEV